MILLTKIRPFTLNAISNQYRFFEILAVKHISFCTLTLIHLGYFADKGIRGFTPPPCISRTAIGRDLKFSKDYNWFKPRSHANFQVNPMAPGPISEKYQ